MCMSGPNSSGGKIVSKHNNITFFFCRSSPTRARTASFSRFLDHTQWYTTVCRTPLDEGSARRRYLNLTTHNTHKRQIFMASAGFELAVPASNRPQALALDPSATDIGMDITSIYSIFWLTVCPIAKLKIPLLVRPVVVSFSSLT